MSKSNILSPETRVRTVCVVQEQALHARQPVREDALVHHSDKSSQQDRIDPQACPLKNSVGGGVGNVGMGGLVHQPPAARIDRINSPCGS